MSQLKETELENLGVVLSALRTFRGDRRSQVAYVGMPVTTGRRFFEALSSQGVKTLIEFTEKAGKEAFRKQVIEPNIREGITLADKLGARENLLCVAPSVFDARTWNWSQDAYMALWYNVIAEFSGRHFVVDGWEYSLGGLREVFFSMMLSWRCIRWYNKDQAARIFGLESLFAGLDHKSTQNLFEEMQKIRVYDSDGKEITIDKALALSVNAICDLRDRGFECDDFVGIAWSLKGLPILSPFVDDGPSNWETDLYFQAREKLEKIVSGMNS